MPFFVIDSNTNVVVNIDDWLLTRHTRGNPLCRVQNCHAVMSIVGEHNPDRATHFRHPHNINCPSIVANAVPYQQLQNVPQNHAQTIMVKTLFFDNIHRIFNKSIDLIPNLSFREFFEIIDNANNLNIWSYTNIDMEYIPYILCTCKPFFPQRRPFRNNPFHFVFGEIQRVDELWINVANNANILYRVNRNSQDVEIENIVLNLNQYNNDSNLSESLVNSISNLLNI